MLINLDILKSNINTTVILHKIIELIHKYISQYNRWVSQFDNKDIISNVYYITIIFLRITAIVYLYIICIIYTNFNKFTISIYSKLFRFSYQKYNRISQKISYLYYCSITLQCFWTKYIFKWLQFILRQNNKNLKSY